MNDDGTYISTIEFKGKKLTLHKAADDPMKVQFYLNTIKGEPYVDINKILPMNMLVNAIWVETGGIEEEIADMIVFLEKTDRTTKSGYNNFIMYKVG